MKPPDIAARLFEDTVYNRPHAPLTGEAQARWEEIEALKIRLCTAAPGEIPGLLAELTQALELYHTYEKRDVFILGFKAGGQAMRQMLEP